MISLFFSETLISYFFFFSFSSFIFEFGFIMDFERVFFIYLMNGRSNDFMKDDLICNDDSFLMMMIHPFQ